MLKIKHIETRIDDDFLFGPLSLNVEPGMITAIVGNNGAGKTALFRMIMEMVKPTSGELTRIHTDETEWKRELAYMPQTLIGVESFSLKQMADLQKIAFTNWNEAEFNRLLTLFNLPRKKKISSLSVGMQKKAMFSLILSRPSRMLLLDEPFAGVDLEGQVLMRKELVSYMERDDGQSILLATHSTEDIRTLADYIYLIKDGKEIGMFEKDMLVESWARLWVNVTIDQSVEGVVHFQQQGPLTEVITENIFKTEASFARADVKIDSVQRIELAEILKYLLKN